MSEYHTGIVAGLIWAALLYLLGDIAKILWDVRQGKRVDRFGILPGWFFHSDEGY